MATYDHDRIRQPGSVVLREWNAKRQLAKAAAGRAARGYNAAQINRLTNSWTTAPTNINQDLHRDRRILVARARELRRNNDYARHFLSLIKGNVVGASGMSLQVQALRDDGRIDEADSSACEQAFARWARLGNCEVTGKLSFVDFQRLYLDTLGCDGEVLVRRIRGRGPFGYQLQMLDPLLIDDTYNVDLAGNVRVRMGVEIDGWGKVLAYHFLPDNVNDIYRSGIIMGGVDRIRVPVDEVWHDFITEAPGQLRGIPWMATAAVALNMLAGYEESAVIAARAGASQMGFYTKTGEGVTNAADSLAQGTDAAGELITEMEPGTFGILPDGYEFTPFNPDYPHAMFGGFVKQCLRRIAAGLPGASYTSLSGDSESVNYSSGRIDLIRERESWKALQNFMVERLMSRVYSEWLPFALAGGHVVSGGRPLPFSKLAKYDAAVWQGVRWPWVDPEKEIKAAVLAIDSGLTSRGRVIREQGGDPEEVWLELEKEQERLKGVLKPKNEPPGKPGGSTSGDDDDK